MEAIASRLVAILSRAEAIALRLEAIVMNSLHVANGQDMMSQSDERGFFRRSIIRQNVR